MQSQSTNGPDHFGDNFIPVISVDHTSSHPICADKTCPCQQQRYATYQAYQSGLLSNEEMARIMQNHQQVESVARMKPATQIAPRIMAIGKGAMLVDNEDFINGYQAGHLACILDCRNVSSGKYALTNDNVTAIMMEKLEDVDLPFQYAIGYCIGWSATFATKGNTPQQESVEVAH